MKKSIIICTMLAMVISLGTAFAGSEDITADQAYLDKQFDRLGNQLTEVRGDTAQIIAILGNVFEGTVPSGGTLQKLCDENGWSLMIVMGHNDIVDPNEVNANTKFTYPQTVAEFQAAKKKGKKLYHAWLAKQEKTFRVNRIKADTVDIDKLNVRVARITEKLTVKEMEIDELNARVVSITEKLTVKNAEIENLRVENAEIDHLKIRLAELDELRVRLLEVNEALIEKLRIKDFEVQRAKNEKVTAEKRAVAAENQPPEVVTKTVYAEVGYNAPASMRLMEDGDKCDERIVHGGVPAAVWDHTGGQSVAIFELHQRSDEDKIAEGSEFKAKSLVVVNASTAIPMVWDDGTCIRIYRPEPISEDELRSMMSDEETIDMIEFSDINKKFKGTHNTIGILLRYAN